MSYDHGSRTFTFMLKAGVKIICTDAEGESIPVYDKGKGRYAVYLDGCPEGEYYIDLSKGKDQKRLVIKM